MTTALKFTATESESFIASSWRRNGGLYFGYSVEPPKDEAHLLQNEWGLTGGVRRLETDRHVLTIGPNGSGKSRRLLLPNLARLKDWSVVVIDPKGELFRASAPYRAAQPGHKVRLYDPFGVVKSTYGDFAKWFPCKSERFNPLAALDKDSPRFVDQAKGLASALIKQDENSKEKYWTDAARALVKGVLMASRVKNSGASLQAVRQIIGSDPKALAKGLKRWCVQLGEQYPAIPATLGEFVNYSPEDRELGGIRRQAKVQTDWLDSREVGSVMGGKNDYDFARLKVEPTTVYLVLPPDFLNDYGVWLRLMIASILRPLMRSVEVAPVPVLFMLDEFAALGRMEVVENNYAMMRGYGVKLWTVWQDLNQAKRIYSDWWESLISNSAMTQIFAPQDMATRKYFSDLADDRVRWEEKKSQSDGSSFGPGGGSFNSGTSTSEQRIQEKLMFPYQLAEMSQGRSLLFTQTPKLGGRVSRAYFPDVSQIGAQMPEVAAMLAAAKL